MQFNGIGVILAIIVVAFLVYVLVTRPNTIYTFEGWIYVVAIIYFLSGIFGWLTPAMDATFTVLILALLLSVVFQLVVAGVAMGEWNWVSLVIALIAVLFIVMILWSYHLVLSARPNLWFLAIFTIGFLVFDYFVADKSAILNSIKLYYYIYVVALMLVALGLFYLVARFVPVGTLTHNAAVPAPSPVAAALPKWHAPPI